MTAGSDADPPDSEADGTNGVSDAEPTDSGTPEANGTSDPDQPDRAFGALIETVESHDVLVVLGTLLAVYVFFTALYLFHGLVLGRPPAAIANNVFGSLQTVTFFAAAYALLALALNLQWGYTGLFNIGIAGFMAVGVYTMGFLSTSPDAGSGMGLGLPLPIGILGGMIAAALVGLIAALPALRLRADYLAIVTLGLSEIIRLTYNSRGLSDATMAVFGFGSGGGSGLTVPRLPAREFVRSPAGEPLLLLADAIGLRRSIAVSWADVVVLALAGAAVYWLMLRIGYSPFGRVLKAIREDELVANSLGKNTDVFKIKVFMLGCALMGLGGILWQGSRGFVSPDSFRPIITFYIFVALIIGGAGSTTGSVVGGIVFAGFLFEGPRRVGSVVDAVFSLPSPPGTFAGAVAPLASLDPLPFVAYVESNIAALQFVLLGAVLVVLMQRRPDGLLGHRSETAAAIDLSGGPPNGGPAEGRGGDRDE